MNNSATLENLYQMVKTLRFGLTLPEKIKKSDSKETPYKSHSELYDLVKCSEQKIVQEAKKTNGNQEISTDLPLSKIRRCLNDMYKYLNDWSDFYNRYDQIAVLKDFYRKLTRKTRFNGFWRENNKNSSVTVKKPQSQIIKLASLNSKYDDKKRRDYIIDYWKENIQKAKRKFCEVDFVLKQFEEAEQQNRNDKNLNIVELRKLFFSLTSLINDTLEPLCNGSICFSDIAKITNNKSDKQLQEFVDNVNFRNELSAQIEELRNYFASNGGYIPYGRVTLNKYTALQKPNRVDDEIKKLIDKLGLSQLVNKYESGEELNNFLKTIKDKKDKIQSKNKKDKVQSKDKSSLTLIERVQLFKYKTIPAGVQLVLIEYLSRKEKKDKKILKELLRAVGQPQSPAKDYKELPNKTNFDLNEYPLKIAFDYAWESLAKNEYHQDIDFPKEKCQEFLKKVFEIDTSNNKDFKLYSALSFIR
ncbi:MAG: hypothetical protein LBI18_02265, partial [Planctomycetaceae bacterium]|nr:hypothetical protein [Planctomycetaceae bacterium]